MFTSTLILLIPFLTITFLGMAVFFALFPQYFDPSMTAAQAVLENLASSGQAAPALELWVIVAGQTITGILIALVLKRDALTLQNK